ARFAAGDGWRAGRQSRTGILPVLGGGRHRTTVTDQLFFGRQAGRLPYSGTPRTSLTKERALGQLPGWIEVKFIAAGRPDATPANERGRATNAFIGVAEHG